MGYLRSRVSTELCKPRSPDHHVLGACLGLQGGDGQDVRRTLPTSLPTQRARSEQQVHILGSQTLQLGAVAARFDTGPVSTRLGS